MFIDTVKKLHPKVVIIENVEGLVLGEAFKYVQKIYKQLEEAGYKVHHWLLMGEKMGVPQTRHRVFFIACSNEIGIDPKELNMTFLYEEIPYGTFKTEHEKITKGKMHDAIVTAQYGESVVEIMRRVYGKESGITHRIAWENKVFPTQIADHGDIWTQEGNHPSNEDIIHAQTFPEDYDLNGMKAEYICGMSVPPVMMKRIVQRLIVSPFQNEKNCRLFCSFFSLTCS